MEIKKILTVGFAAVLLVGNIFAWQEVFALADANLHVWFLNVGQGDCEFIETPDSRQVIIDGGPTSAVLGEVSKIMGFFDRKIDVVVLSHPEKDHMQGLIEVLKKYKAAYILQSGIEKDDAEFLEWKNVLAQQEKMGAKVVSVKIGDIVRLGNVELKILAPLEDLSGKKVEDSSNNTCVVAKLIYGKNSFLFAGDIDSKEEKRLAEIASSQAPRNDESGIGAWLACDVLKVAHHGSKYSTSEEFLWAVDPEFAVIEVGKNSYGHPTPETLQRLEKFGIKILRTDIDRNIEFISNGVSLENN